MHLVKLRIPEMDPGASPLLFTFIMSTSLTAVTADTQRKKNNAQL